MVGFLRLKEYKCFCICRLLINRPVRVTRFLNSLPYLVRVSFDSSLHSSLPASFLTFLSCPLYLNAMSAKLIFFKSTYFKRVHIYRQRNWRTTFLTEITVYGTIILFNTIQRYIVNPKRPKGDRNNEPKRAF